MIFQVKHAASVCFMLNILQRKAVIPNVVACFMIKINNVFHAPLKEIHVQDKQSLNYSIDVGDLSPNHFIYLKITKFRVLLPENVQ